VSISNRSRSLSATCFLHPPDLSWIPILFPQLIRTHMFTTRSVSSTTRLRFPTIPRQYFILRELLPPGKILSVYPYMHNPTEFLIRSEITTTSLRMLSAVQFDRILFLRANHRSQLPVLPKASYCHCFWWATTSRSLTSISSINQSLQHRSLYLSGEASGSRGHEAIALCTLYPYKFVEACYLDLFITHGFSMILVPLFQVPNIFTYANLCFSYGSGFIADG
jgi:hypothetical protein